MSFPGRGYHHERCREDTPFPSAHAHGSSLRSYTGVSFPQTAHGHCSLLIAVVIFSPFMIVTAIAIKATDGGSIFYRQRRLTKDGKEFDVLKFRSMRMDAEKDGVARLSTGETTPVLPKWAASSEPFASTNFLSF